MPINPEIALSYKSPEIASPLQNIGALMGLRGSLSEIALRNAQVEQARQNSSDLEAQAAQRNRDLADQSAVSEALKDDETAKQVYGGNFSALDKLGIQPKSREAIATAVQTQLEKHATLTTSQLAQEQTSHQHIGSTLAALQEMRNPDGSLDIARVNQSLPGVLASLQPDLQILSQNGHLDLSKLPTAIGSEDELKQMASGAGAISAMTDAALELRKTKAATQETAGKGAESQAAADLASYKLTLMKGAGQGDPAARAAAIRGMSIFAGHPQEAQDAVDAAEAEYQAALKSSDPTQAAEKSAAAVKDVADRLRASSPGVLAGKKAEQAALLPGEVTKAVQVEQATSPLKVNEQVAAARALRAGDNTAVANVAPGAISQVQEHAIKLDEGYAKAKQATDAMDELLSLAGSGNKAAAANIPLAGVAAVNAINGIKRINSAEISQYGTAGSLLDEIKGKLGKWTEGQPIPKDVLADIKTLHDSLGQQAYQKYSGELRSLNARTGSTYQPTYEPPAAKVASVPPEVQKVLSGTGPGIHTLSDGTKWLKASDGSITKQ